jgi:magnesium transporter
MPDFVLHVRADGTLQEALSLGRGDEPAHAVTWVSLEGEPGNARDVLEAWGFHSLAVEDVLRAHTRSKFERYPGHGFARVPALDRSTPDPLDTVGIYVFLRPGTVVTIAPAGAQAIAAAREAVRAHPLRGGHCTERILYAILDEVAEEYEEVVSTFEPRLEVLLAPDPTAHSHARSHGLAARVRLLDDLRTDGLQLRRILAPFREMVARVSEPAGGASAESLVFFRDVLDHVQYMVEECDLVGQIVSGRITTLEAELRDEVTRANDRLNQVMKYMAVMSTLLLPMTIVSGAFGMNFRDIPWAEHPHGFWMATGTMLLAAMTLLAVFRVRRWI